MMTASAVQAYVNRYAVRPGRRAVVFTNNDGGYGAALDMKAAGVEIAAVVDARPAIGGNRVDDLARLVGQRAGACLKL